MYTLSHTGTEFSQKAQDFNLNEHTPYSFEIHIMNNYFDAGHTVFALYLITKNHFLHIHCDLP